MNGKIQGTSGSMGAPTMTFTTEPRDISPRRLRQAISRSGPRTSTRASFDSIAPLLTPDGVFSGAVRNIFPEETARCVRANSSRSPKY